MLEENTSLVLQLLLVGTQVDPSFDALSLSGVVGAIVDEFLNDLASSFELLSMPQERGSAHQVFVGSHFLALVKLHVEGVDCFLVYVAAAFVVVNESECRREGNFAPILHAGEFAYGFGDAALVEDAERLPENEDWVLSFGEFLGRKVREGERVTLSQKFLQEPQRRSRMK